MKRKIRELTRDVKHPEEALPWFISLEVVNELRRRRRP